MTISRVFALVLSAMAIAAISKFAVSAWSSYRDYVDTSTVRSLAEIRTATIDATVAMSLERSVVQVALALEDPIPAEFREIVDNQRQMAEDGIDFATARLNGMAEIDTRSAFLSELRRYLTRIDGIREEIDGLLAKPLSARDAERVYELPFELKAAISGLKNVVFLLQSDIVVGSAVAGAYEKMQSRAWEGREFAGRARTYFAIATLRREPLRAFDKPVIRLDRSRADDAWDALQKSASTIALPESLTQALQAVETQYYGVYVPVIDGMEHESAQVGAGGKTAYPVPFGEFFELSNNGLNAFAALSSIAGRELTHYWSQRESQSFQSFLASMLLMCAIAVLAIGALAFMRARVTRKLEAVTKALTDVANGDVTVTMERSQGDLFEIGEMADALNRFKQNASIQLATTSAVQSNRTPMFVVDQKGDVITRNRAFDELWAKLSGRVGDLVQTKRAAASANDAELGLNFQPLLQKADDAEKSGEQLRKKANGDRAVDVPHKDLVIELKRSPIRDKHGATVGTAIEIADVTLVRQLETEVLEVISGVERGVFDKRILHIDNLGFTSIAARGLNNLMDHVSCFMSELDSALQALAAGDMTRQIDGAFTGEFKAAADHFNGSVDSFSETLEGVLGAVERIRKETDLIATGSRDLASRAEAQASTLEETAATMEEMAANIKVNASNAERASEASDRTRGAAEDGGEVVQETVSAMSRIEESSDKIREIIDVIEGIAFQTNLLALNAAIEAARAGEAGNGFAVVASEVRALAQRSASAAHDVKTLIEASGSNVADGVTLVRRTGQSLSEIVEEIRSVAGMMTNISASVKEQSSGIAEITSSFGHLDEMTQHNSVMAEESASAAKVLFDAASELSLKVSQFKIRRAAGAAGAPHAMAVGY